jgi:CRP/FNR family transcriptional regulator
MNERLNVESSKKNYGGGFFDKIPLAALRDLESMHPARSFPENIALFTEQYPTEGVFVVVDGAVKLTVSSSSGRKLSLRIARRGAILGLASTMSGGTYDATATTLCPVRIVHIPRQDFFSFINRHREAYQVALEELSCNLSEARRQLRTIGLFARAPAKLASLLLDMSKGGQVTESGGTRFRLLMTHEEIGECIGSTRETVTRLLGKFKSLRLLAMKGSMLTISNRAAFADYGVDGCDPQLLYGLSK